MIPKECKRLAEVDFPIAVVSKHSAREKSIRHGHPSTLHLWWARRPLAACRAMLLGLLLPDPCDPHCPKEFREMAAKTLLEVPGWDTERRELQLQSEEGLRRALLDFLGDVADWDVANDPRWINSARELVKAAYPEEPPLVVDPFAGGGSIPLEALRLSGETFASDLNPVACLILKVMLEDIPRHGHKLADELLRVGSEIKKQAEKELAEFYPKDPDGATPIAYLWARTVRCESPNCGAEIPLARSYWLCKKLNRKRALRYSAIRPKDGPPCLEFDVFEPNSDGEVPHGTVTRGNATCPCCNMVLPVERVRAQLAEQRGGADAVFDAKGNRLGGARLLVVVTINSGRQHRNYRLPTGSDYQAVWKARQRLRQILVEWERLPPDSRGLSPVPNEPLPQERQKGSSGFRVLLYGMDTFGDLFTTRQKVAVMTLAHLLRGNSFLPMMISKIVRHCNALTFWHRGSETVAGAFGRQAIPMCWDFPEYYPFAGFAGDMADAIGDLTNSVCSISRAVARKGQWQLCDSRKTPLPDDAASVWFTDPPYYDNIAYADLSDFFYVWLKRAMPNDPVLRDPFNSRNPLTPKRQEIIQDPARRVGDAFKNTCFYENAMADSFAEGRRVLSEDGVGSVVFAHKTTEGWEALLSGMIRGGWTITGSWPIATERGARLLARETAALATSVHLVCRPRAEDAPVGDWGEVLRELPRRVGDWMERLQSEGIRGADLVFACIGPALEIFSRYRKVETAEGREVKLAEFLEKVWEVVGRTALENVLGTNEARARNGVAGALEEDARLTALFLWTLQSTNGNISTVENKEDKEVTDDEEDEDDVEEGGRASTKTKGYSLVFDVVRRFAQPLGINLDRWKGRIIEIRKGVVRLMAVSERACQLFGEEGADAVADWIVQDSQKDFQQLLFPELEGERAPKIRGRGKRRKVMTDAVDVELQGLSEPTTLDRVHAAMLLQAGGKANALRDLIKSEQQRGPGFMRLANALSALYPKGSEEKRLLDAMLQAVPR